MKFELVLTVPVDNTGKMIEHRKVKSWKLESDGNKVKFVPPRRAVKKAIKEFMEKIDV